MAAKRMVEHDSKTTDKNPLFNTNFYDAEVNLTTINLEEKSDLHLYTITIYCININHCLKHCMVLTD